MKGEREFTVFEVESDMAHFRRPYAITTALSFPVPPRTALCGLVGAILGLPKNDSLREFGDDRAIFGLQLLEPVRSAHCSLNLLDTKENPTFRPKAENPHTQMRYEYIRAPRYRIYFSHPELSTGLREMVRDGHSVYTPCLGLAWMIAWFSGEPSVEPGEFKAEPYGSAFGSLVRSEDLAGDISWEEAGMYQRLRMPAVMQPDRLVTRYQEYVVETTGRAIQTTLKQHWRLASGYCFSPM
jgi:CRISPR-associated protein Cas5h